MLDRIGGIPLSTKPGPQHLEVRAATGNHEETFIVGNKHYREQRITLKDKLQVNPSTQDLKGSSQKTDRKVR